MKKEKKSHGVQLLIRCVVRDPDGKIITDTGRKPAKSFVIQFLEYIYYCAIGGTQNATEVDGTEDVIYTFLGVCTGSFAIDGAINEDTHGIVIGTGDTAETNTDFALDVQLTEGVGAGQITHGAQVVGAAGVVGANVDLEIKRAFTNNTGSNITVKEAGVYVTNYDARWHCIIRDVLALSCEVPDRCSLSVIYTVRTTV